LSAAAGASGLPAGVFAPHVSPDDSVLSRLSRCGVRATLQALAASGLVEGDDWSACGVLEHEVDGKNRLPAAWSGGTAPGADWSRPADAAALKAAGLPDATVGTWHARGGWLRPARLVRALLAHPAIHWQGRSTVARLEPVSAPDGTKQWQAYDSDGTVVRVYESLGRATATALATAIPHRAAWRTDMLERRVDADGALDADAAPADLGAVALRPFEIATFVLESP